MYYANVVQTAYLPTGSYRFTAWIKADGITTNEGPQFQIYDPENSSRLDLRTGPVIGTSDWLPVDQPFTVPPGTNLVNFRVLREQTQKFDNKVAGTAWIDSVTVRPYR